MISVSLRNKFKTGSNFNLKLVNYKRINPQYKNLKYKIILKHLSKLNTRKSDIALIVGNKILESGTSNLLFATNNKIFSPINNFYKGTNYKYFEKKIRILKKNIYLEQFNKFDEIILIGSGKGITSVKDIKEIKWKRKNDKIFKKLLLIYNKEINKQKNIYKFL